MSGRSLRTWTIFILAIRINIIFILDGNTTTSRSKELPQRHGCKTDSQKAMCSQGAHYIKIIFLYTFYIMSTLATHNNCAVARLGLTGIFCLLVFKTVTKIPPTNVKSTNAHCISKTWALTKIHLQKLSCCGRRGIPLAMAYHLLPQTKNPRWNPVRVKKKF